MLTRFLPLPLDPFLPFSLPFPAGFDTMWVTSVDNYQQDGVIFKGNVRNKDPSAAYAKMKQRLAVSKWKWLQLLCACAFVLVGLCVCVCAGGGGAARGRGAAAARRARPPPPPPPRRASCVVVN